MEGKIKNKNNFIILLTFLFILFPSTVIFTEAAEEKEGAQEKYFDLRFNLGFSIPQNWCMLSEKKHEKLFRLLKQKIKANKDYKLLCFLMEEKNLNIFDSSDLWNETICPMITVMASPRSIPFGRSSKPAEIIIEDRFRKLKQSFLKVEELSENKLHTKSGKILNDAGEAVLKIIVKSPVEQQSATGVLINYYYIHLDQNNTRLHEFLIICACLSSQEEEYMPKFDSFMRNFLAID